MKMTDLSILQKMDLGKNYERITVVTVQGPYKTSTDLQKTITFTQMVHTDNNGQET